MPAFEMPVLCAAEAWRSALGRAGPSSHQGALAFLRGAEEQLH